MQDKLQTWVELVAKLNALTQDGKLKWTRQPIPGPSTLRDTLFVKERFVAPYKDKNFVLTSSTPTSLLSIQKQEENKIIKLEIADSDSKALVEIPDVVGIPDLYESVRFHASEVKQFINDFLNEK